MNQLANRRWHALALAAVAMTLAACVGTGQPVRTDASNQGRAMAANAGTAQQAAPRAPGFDVAGRGVAALATSLSRRAG